MILALDTTTEFGSIALTEGADVFEEVPLHSPDGFGHVLFGHVERLLANHRLTFAQIDMFACASGPGSFTGVRMGLTAAKGLAEATGRKVVAISNLQAMAFFGTRALRAPVLDARRGEVYGAVYDSDCRLVCGEVVTKFPLWLASLPAGDIEILTSGFPVEGVGIPVVRVPRALAGAIGRIAFLHRDQAKDPAEIDANYVRKADAE